MAMNCRQMALLFCWLACGCVVPVPTSESKPKADSGNAARAGEMKRNSDSNAAIRVTEEQLIAKGFKNDPILGTFSNERIRLSEVCALLRCKPTDFRAIPCSDDTYPSYEVVFGRLYCHVCVKDGNIELDENGWVKDGWVRAGVNLNSQQGWTAITEKHAPVKQEVDM